MASKVDFNLSAAKAAARDYARLSATLQRQVEVRTLATLRRRMLPLLREHVQGEFTIGTRNLNSRLQIQVQGNTVIAYGDKRRIGLEQFSGRYAGRRSAGATAQIRSDDGRSTYGSAFIIKSRRAIWARKLVHEGRTLTGKLSRGARAGRFPIVRLHGPSAVEMALGDPRYQVGLSAAERTAIAIEEIFSAEIDRQVAIASRRAAGG